MRLIAGRRRRDGAGLAAHHRRQPGRRTWSASSISTSTAARAAADEHGFADVPVAASLEELVDRSEADAVINVTVPAAHPRSARSALPHGLPVLCEKPLAETVGECLSMIAAAEAARQVADGVAVAPLLSPGGGLRRQLAELGPIGSLSCEFFKAPHFGGFREQMAEPLLVDMAIHQFDLARKLIGAEPVVGVLRVVQPRLELVRRQRGRVGDLRVR